MLHSFGRLLIAVGLTALPVISAQASPACLKDQKAFALSDDFVTWTMAAAPGSECIQGLRWSYMQINNVLVLKPPTKGKLLIVGSGFRYLADEQNRGEDSFTLVVFGKNKRDEGKSVLDIVVKQRTDAVASVVTGRP